MKSSVWAREQRRSASRESLSREQIVRAAVELLDQEGLDGLSMRKLAGRLSSGATSLYWWVETKDDLLEYALDEVYGEVDVPEPELAGWRSGATLFAHSLRAAILRHPWFPSVVNGRASIGPKAMSLTSRAMTLIGAAGFTGVDLDFAVSSLVGYVMGTAGFEAGWLSSVETSGVSANEWVHQMREQAIESVGDEYPELREHLAQWSGTDVREVRTSTFTFGLECMLDGLVARLDNASGKPT
jgi:AcrR family transcriptional regulator